MNITFKDVLNVAAGEMFYLQGSPDRFIQSIQMIIIMIGSNPWF